MLSRDLGIILASMFFGFVIGYGAIGVSNVSNDAEVAGIAAAVSSALGMLLGYAYLAIEKRVNAPPAYPKRPKTFAPQIVGRACARCQSRIIFVAEAIFCAECRRPFHRRCAKAIRCAECDAKVTLANDVLLSNLDFDIDRNEWHPAGADEP